IPRNSSRSRASRFSATSSSPTRSAGTSSFVQHRVFRLAKIRPAANHWPSNDLRLRMAGMRPPTLMLNADGAYYAFAVAPDAYPPRIPGGQLVPLWKMLPAPTPANTEIGPRSGPDFLSRADIAQRKRAM